MKPSHESYGPNVAMTFAPWSINDENPESYDLFIAACGYESRSTHAAIKLSDRFERLVAYSYAATKEHAFESNLDYFATHGEVVTLPTSALSADIAMRVSQLTPPLNKPIRVGVDISSMDRDRIGVTVRALRDVAKVTRAMFVDYFYSPAAFDEDMVAVEGSVTINRPLLGYGGWNSDPDAPLLCVVGLGFERQLTLAALETLEPSRTVLFRALGGDSRFGDRVDRDNVTLVRSSDFAVTNYDLLQPLRTLRQLEAIVQSAVSTHRVVMVPVGPKIFALASVLVAINFEEEVSVWRVSSAEARRMEDRKPTGDLVGLAVKIAGSAKSQ